MTATVAHQVYWLTGLIIPYKKEYIANIMTVVSYEIQSDLLLQRLEQGKSLTKTNTFKSLSGKDGTDFQTGFVASGRVLPSLVNLLQLQLSQTAITA